MRKNISIALEGMDAAGKHTHSSLLAEKLGGKLYSFPDYNTVAGVEINRHLKKEWDTRKLAYGEFVKDTNDPLVFQALHIVSRLERKPEIIEDMKEGTNLVFDRYWGSACVYGGLEGLDAKWLKLVNEAAMPSPDLWVLIDIPLAESVRRRPERRDRYEQDHEFMERVRSAYLNLFSMDLTTWEGLKERDIKIVEGRRNWFIVNGLASDPNMEKQDRIKEVHNRIAQVIEDRYGQYIWKK